jgi:hypothetical protein
MQRSTLALPVVLLFAAACDSAKAPTAPAGEASAHVAAATHATAAVTPMATLHNLQNAEYAGVPFTLVYDVPNPDGHDLVCSVPSGAYTSARTTLPSCSGTTDLRTLSVSTYSTDEEYVPSLCRYTFEVFDRTTQQLSQQVLFPGCGKPYALTDVRALTRPAHGAVSRPYRDHCDGGVRDVCVETVVFEPGQLAASFAPYYVQVNWGDGTAPVVMRETEFNRRLNYRHTYAAAGTYTVTIVAVTPPNADQPYFEGRTSRNRYLTSTSVVATVQ